MSVTRVFRFECDYCKVIADKECYGFPDGFVYGYNKDTVVHVCGSCKDKLLEAGAKMSKRKSTKIDIPLNLQKHPYKVYAIVPDESSNVKSMIDANERHLVYISERNKKQIPEELYKKIKMGEI